MGEHTTPFGLEESSRFASTLASRDGIRVKQEESNVMPYTDTKGGIHIGIPSIYNHEDYMGSLHKEISKQVKEVSYFNDVKLEPDTLQDVCKDIIQTEVSERYRHGTYDGRDRILADTYSRNLRENGGLQGVVKELAKVNPTVGALMYLNNEMRNKWQGYHHCKPPASISDELDRLGFLEEEWESLETAEDLRILLHRIEFEEPPEEESGDDDNDDSEEGDEGGDGGDGGDGDSSGADQEPEDGDQPEGQGSGEASEGPEGDQGSQGDPTDTDEEGEDKAPNNPGIGAGEGAKKLADMGLVKKPMKAKDAYYEDKEDSVPYTPETRVRECIVEDMPNVGSPVQRDSWHEHGDKDHHVQQTLGSFSLSRKIKKYLLSMKQTGYEYGKKRGKLCSKNVAKLYTGGVQPTIFKQRTASKIQTDTAIFILGDCSGSMSGSKYYTSAASQIATSEVLQALRIPHAMMQFTTDYGLVHYHMKGFEERFVSRDTLVKRYGNGNIEMGCNADGEAVTRAAQILAKRPEKQKVLIVLSDGSPAHGYNDVRFLKDTVKSVEDSRVMSVVGIGIQDSNVKRFYKDYKVINEVTELEPVLLALLKDKVLK